jgi:hypothetical protein
MFIALKAASSCSGVVLAFRAFQAALNSALAVLKSEAEPVGSPPVTKPDARHAFGGQTDTPDALPAFEHGVVTKADRPELQHVPVLKRTTPHQPNILAGRRWLTYWALKFPQHRLVSKKVSGFDEYNHFTANIL